MSTADIIISELAWRFTPEGLIEWRNAIAPDMLSADMQVNERAHDHYNRLSEILVDFCEEVFSISNDQQRAYYAFPALFEWWLSDAPFNNGNSTRSLWKIMRFKRIQIPGFQNGRRIPLCNLWRVVVALTTLPVSESICERCFSQVKRLTSDLNRNMKPELFESLSTIKNGFLLF